MQPMTEGGVAPTADVMVRPAAAVIEARNLSKAFEAKGRSRAIFNNLNCEIRPREFVSIVGPSGCGKPTFLRLVSGLEKPTSGDILFAGRSITRPPAGMLFVFQQYAKSIFPWRTVMQNIQYGLRRQQTISKQESDTRSREYIEILGLKGYEDYFPYQLSGGMQQRVCIARALICKPAVLLMDEPFSAVDAMTRAVLQELLLKLWSTLSITILFVTHDIDEAVFMSTRIITLGRDAGGVVEDRKVDLPTPRHPIQTRANPIFADIRQSLFANIFMQEKALVTADGGEN